MASHKAEIISKIWISVYDQPESWIIVEIIDFSQWLVKKQKLYRKYGFQSMTVREVELWWKITILVNDSSQTENILKIWISVYDWPESWIIVENIDFNQWLVTKQKLYLKYGFQSMTDRKLNYSGEYWFKSITGQKAEIISKIWISVHDRP